MTLMTTDAMPADPTPRDTMIADAMTTEPEPKGPGPVPSDPNRCRGTRFPPSRNRTSRARPPWSPRHGARRPPGTRATRLTTARPDGGPSVTPAR